MQCLLALLLAACAAVNAYQLPGPVAPRFRTAAAPSMMAGKGFGKPALPPPPPKKKSAGAVKRDAASTAMDELTASGSPGAPRDLSSLSQRRDCWTLTPAKSLRQSTRC